jgi:hypothetical protein
MKEMTKKINNTDDLNDEANKKGHQKKTEREVESYGEPRFLQGVMTCINKRCDILGLNAPMKIAETTPDGKIPASQWVLLLQGKQGIESANGNQPAES